MQQIISWCQANADVLVPAILGAYEVLLRIKPTAKDWSLLNLAMKFINYALPNKSKQGGTH